LLNKGVMVQKGLLMVQKGKKLHRRTRVVEASLYKEKRARKNKIIKLLICSGSVYKP